MKKIMYSGLVIGALAALAPEAQAAQQCGKHEKIVEVLGKQFQENREAIGLSGQSALIEVFVSQRGTWTMTLTNTRGITCVIGAGEAWQSAMQVVAGIDS